MRGDGVGVGDIGEVPGDAWSSGDTASGDDGRGAIGKRDTGVVCGLGVIERDATDEPSGDRFCVGDDTRGEHGACDVHGAGTGRAHGMRGDGVGVGGIGEVPGDAWSSGERRVVMTAGDWGGSFMRAWTVDLGSWSVMRRQNRAETESASLTIHGASMVLVTYTGRARVRYTGCEATKWESETSVRCLVTLRDRGTWRLMMTTGERGESVTNAWLVDLGSLSVIQRQN